MRALVLLVAVACTGSTPAPARPTAPPVSAPTLARAGANAVKVTVLSTMLVGERDKGIGEWGFAALVEVDGTQVLVDTGGRPETVLRNAAELKIDLSTVEDVVLTHGHDDHTSGLVTLRRELRARNPKALSRAHVGTDFFATRVDDEGEWNNDELRRAYEALGGTWVEHAGPAELAPHVWLTGPVPRPNAERNWSALGKLRRGGALVEDTVPEDSSVVVEMPEGLLIVSGCGHAGIVNIAEYAQRLRGGPVNAVVGGVHLFNQSDTQVAWTGKKLKAMGVAFVLAAHCTGIEALYQLRDVMGLARATAVVAAVGASFTRGTGIDPMPLAR